LVAKTGRWCFSRLHFSPITRARGGSRAGGEAASVAMSRDQTNPLSPVYPRVISTKRGVLFLAFMYSLHHSVSHYTHGENTCCALLDPLVSSHTAHVLNSPCPATRGAEAPPPPTGQDSALSCAPMVMKGSSSLTSLLCTLNTMFSVEASKVATVKTAARSGTTGGKFAAGP